MKVKKLLIAMVFSVAVLGGYQAYEYASMTGAESFLLENVEALASGEVVGGKECRYKGTGPLDTWFECTSDYPNLGPCGERVTKCFSDNKAQCLK